MDIYIIDFGFISWWHSRLMMFAINWRAGWPTSMQYGDISWIDLDMRPFDAWKVIESVGWLYRFGPFPVEENPVIWSSGV